jgi:hypothetical protein
VATVKEDIFEVNSASNPDLFLAMRGVGANIVIATSVTYKVKPLTNNGNILR